MRIVKYILLIAAILMVIATGIGVWSQPQQRAPEPPVANSANLERAQAIVNSHLYNATCGHAVVCGGVRSQADVDRVRQSDAAVRSLYASLGKVKLTLLEHSLFAYDSYRVGNKIYWTKKPRLIRKGELVLSDGSFAILARCGNLVSLTPQVPVEEGDVPSDLYPPDEPVVDVPAPDVTDVVPPLPIYADSVPPAPPQPPSYVPNVPVPPCCGIFVPNVPPTTVPEPSTLSLLLAGGIIWTVVLFCEYLLGRRR